MSSTCHSDEENMDLMALNGNPDASTGGRVVQGVRFGVSPRNGAGSNLTVFIIFIFYKIMVEKFKNRIKCDKTI